MLEFETAGTMKESWARPCDACRRDLAYLCSPCDVRIHEHERVWVCESCERAPAAFLCKADSASLCAACDADIHSANPLARRHLRVPIQPVPTATSLYCPNLGGDMNMMMTPELAEEEDEEAWLLVNPMNNGEEYGDEYLDLDEYNQMSLSEGYSCNNQQQHYGGDSIVPIKYEEGNSSNCFQLLGYTAITYPPSISQTVSISSMDVGIVPESASHTSSVRAPKGTIDLFSSPLQNQNEGAPSPMDREARVMRYREKKKTRKFEKTIRYASRKAYAETRPRIKGRFAKRRGQVLQLDDHHHQIFSSQSLMSSDVAYGVVPSF